MIRQTIPATLFVDGTKRNTVLGLSKTVSQRPTEGEVYIDSVCLNKLCMRPFPSCVGLSFLLLKEPRVLSRQIRSHDLLLGDEDRRPSCLDSGDSRRAKVVTNEL